jgi:NAD(P)H-dependent FMN reductase
VLDWFPEADCRSAVHIVGVDGSPVGAGTTRYVVGEALEHAHLSMGATTSLLDMSVEVSTLVEALDVADAVVLGTPIYRAMPAASVKQLLDAVPRGDFGDPRSPLQGTPVMLVGTAKTWAHYLGLDNLRTILHVFFAAWVVPPGVYLVGSDHVPGGVLSEDARELLYRQVAALTGFVGAARDGSWATSCTPQV